MASNRDNTQADYLAECARMGSSKPKPAPKVRKVVQIQMTDEQLVQLDALKEGPWDNSGIVGQVILAPQWNRGTASFAFYGREDFDAIRSLVRGMHVK